VATRTSSRVPKDGIPIATKATNRVKALNDCSGTSSQNPFTILNNTSSDALQKVICDLDLEKKQNRIYHHLRCSTQQLKRSTFAC